MPGMGDLNKMLSEVDAEQDMKRLFGIIDSMTPEERRHPKSIDMSRRLRISRGAGVEPAEVNDLVKQFDGMASIMKQMAGKGIRDRMKMVQQVQQSGALGPGGRIAKVKQGTGKRLSPKRTGATKETARKRTTPPPPRGTRRIVRHSGTVDSVYVNT